MNKAKQIVYLVVAKPNDTSEGGVMAVFATRKLANDYIKAENRELKEAGYGEVCDWEVEAHEVEVGK